MLPLSKEFSYENCGYVDFQSRGYNGHCQSTCLHDDSCMIAICSNASGLPWLRSTGDNGLMTCK